MSSSLRLYNTQTHQKEIVTQREGFPGITMYVCGPTVYDTPHIGNARPVVVFDVLNRLLRNDFPSVVYARNYTDVDDKIIARSRERGISIAELCETTIVQYETVMGALNVIEPTLKPRATEHIGGMVKMIEKLVDTGYAYAVDGHVLFDTTKYPQGVLTGQTEGRDHARIEEASYKRNQSDFVLWKPADGEVGWDSPWGAGRPGWHIECSAMISEHLGATIDIHGGGQDLIFPHHEAECAQSECYHHAPLARYWVHNAMVLSDGQKMSKSLGNFITVADVLKKHPGEVLKFAMLQTHYRHPFDFRWSRLQEADAALRRLSLKANSVEASDQVDAEFLAALRDDLNTPLAIKRLHDMPAENLKASMSLLGFAGKQQEEALSPTLQALLDLRNEARANKDWGRSDFLRDELLRFGIAVRDSASGTEWERVSVNEPS